MRNTPLGCCLLVLNFMAINGCAVSFIRDPILDLIGPTTAVAVIQSADYAHVGTTLQLEGGNSYLLSGSGAAVGARTAGFTFSWSVTAVPDGAPDPTLEHADTPLATFSANVPGFYTIELTVSDGAQTGSTSAPIEVL